MGDHAILFTRRSDNAKTGPMPVSTTDKASCPADCEMRAGCYAMTGPLGILWSRMSDAGPASAFLNGRSTARTLDWDGLCAAVATLDEGTGWRHNQAGDLPHDGGRIDQDMLSRLVKANAGRRGFTYTHHNVLQSDANRSAVAAAVAAGFVINLSANNPRHADQLAGLDIAPVAVVLPSEYGRGASKGTWTESYIAYRERLSDLALETPEGRKIVVCPATYRDDVNCMSCMLCQRSGRRAIVGFPAHGARKKTIDAMAA